MKIKCVVKARREFTDETGRVHGPGSVVVIDESQLELNAGHLKRLGAVAGPAPEITEVPVGTGPVGAGGVPPEKPENAPESDAGGDGSDESTETADAPETGTESPETNESADSAAGADAPETEKGSE